MSTEQMQEFMRAAAPWAAIGTAWENDPGLGISPGMLVGLAIGLCIHKEAEKTGQ